MYEDGKIQALGVKQCYFKIRSVNGKIQNGQLKLDFLSQDLALLKV